MKNLILGLLICTSTVVFGQKIDCNKFKIGKFKIEDAELGKLIIERKGKKQIEYSEASKIKLKFKVEWIKDCVYTLKLKKVMENPNNVSFPKDMIITVKIIEIRENSYVQQSYSNLYDFVYESEVVKIE